MPAYTYTKAQNYATYEPSPLLLKKASAAAVPAPSVPVSEVPKGSSTAHLLTKFIESHRALENFKHGQPVVVDGETLSIPAVAAVARYAAATVLDDSSDIQERVLKSRQVIADKVSGQKSVYGVSTGFGGSADTRTSDPLTLGLALFQHQHTGVLPSDTEQVPTVLPLLDPLTSTSMPESWVRGAILIRMNSLIRGHSGVRWELIERMGALLRENIIPLVPLRGSISASGDLSPLSYIAGTLIGNPSIRVFDGPSTFRGRRIVSSREALAAHHLEPLSLVSKEHLGILNGTAFSASVGALAVHDAVHLALLAQVCTAMCTEAMLGALGSFAPFIHSVARPHPGQVEVADTISDLLAGSQFAVTVEEEKHISADIGELRQDRYPLRTSAQFLGPQVEDILSAFSTITIECNSTTDNPLIDGETGEVHHGGNFQAMSVTNAMEKTRLALHHIGKLLFAQCTELINPAMNRGLPPNLSATDPSHNYFAKGIDIHTAAYVGELGYLANPVSTHVQSAEMHNQAVNSLALISARATLNSLEVLSLLTASYLYALCQALDLRALQHEFQQEVDEILREELTRYFGPHLSTADLDMLLPVISRAVRRSLDSTSTMDAALRMRTVAGATTTPLVDFCAERAGLDEIVSFRAAIAERMTASLVRLREQYLHGEKGAAPASAFLGKSRAVYEYIRVTLGVRMHGAENLHNFQAGPGVEEETIGQNIALIHEAIRDGKMQDVVVGLFV
ncbi:phenylalanine ammonia-lyase [Lentinus tigrinus ALCF2SS1-7]|uniref:Phenylalanine ammonia-lyase n=1 Tax=Lentinus tigrinus ALCF2SS1-6 TaxID=1328759 RepID=A0A5C2S2W6_9APHY|nr:phenylalanine ammonia-lyase [Lentinus tigrinus ALCF2SS1-6]RPD71833.1 phenylalanine ammonia-lyase [Lentinus tigrinus ALCF2SS1-7]